MDRQQTLPASGVIVPMITPMHPDGRVDTESLANLSEWLVGQGVDGLLVLGSTGESAAMAASEKVSAVQSVVSAVGDRTHVMVGIAALGTPAAVDDAAHYAGLGADSLLVSAPFGFPLSPDELSGHFRSVAASAPHVPIVAYDVPSRVKVSLESALLRDLAEDDVIHGLKDSSGNVGGARLRSLALEGTGLRQYTGSEECIDGFLLAGGDASVPGLANVFPGLHVELADRARRGEWERVRDIQDVINRMLALYFHPLPRASFTAQFFALVKETLKQRGVIAHAATSPPFVRGDDELSRFVSSFLAEMQPVVDRTLGGAR